MTTFQPWYQLIVYEPYSVDPTETTVLSPAAGAPHSDDFIVSSNTSVVSGEPYLHVPKGRQSKLDPITKKVTQGYMSLKLLDARVTPGGSNAARWVSAFFGDASGKMRLIGCRAQLRESPTPGGGFTTIFTGRIQNVSLDGKLGVTIELRDMAKDLERLVFTGTPEASIDYAQPQLEMPLGLTNDWGKFAASLPVRATIANKTTTSGIDYGTLVINDLDHLNQWMFSGGLKDSIKDPASPYRFRISFSGSDGIFLPSGRFKHGPVSGKVAGHQAWTELGVQSLKSTDFGYMALPANTSSVTFTCYNAGPTSKTNPLYIADVHPVQLMADILDGKFSTLNADGSARAIASRSGAWASLIADVSFPLFCGVVDRSMKASEFIEKYICQPYQLAYRYNGSGEIVPIDLRRSASIASSGTFTDSDLVELPTQWAISRDEAITGARLTYYIDTPIPRADFEASPDEYPALPTSLVRSAKAEIFVVNDLASVRDVGEKIIEIDAIGMRFAPGQQESTSPQVKEDRLRALAVGSLVQIMAPYANGALRYSLKARRTGIGLTANIGDYVTVSVSTLPDPATNQRGGSRLALITGRSEDGPSVLFDCLDTGASSVAIVPLIGAIAGTGDPGITVPITLNVAGDPVVVEYAVTDNTVVAVGAVTANLWNFGGRVTTSSTLLLRQLPAGYRFWIRARSFPDGATLKLPSAWAYPTGTGYVDLSALTAPSAITKTNTYGNRADLHWTLGSSTYPIEIFYTTGAVPGTWTEAMKVAALPAGSTVYRLTGLANSTQYSVGVRHRDPQGGISAFTTHTWTTGATAGVSARPAGLDICL